MRKKIQGIRRKGNGWELRWTYKGERHRVFAETPDEAEAKQRATNNAVDKGTYRPNDKITLSEYYQDWKNRKERTVKPITIFNYDRTFKTHIEPALGKCRVQNMERRGIRRFLDKLATTKTVATANRTKLVLAAILKSAVEDEIIAINPAAGISNIRDKDNTATARDTIHRELTGEELKAFFTLCEKSRYYPTFQFLLETGVRVGECAGLEWRDIDRRKRIIHIRRTMTKDKNGNVIVGTSAKTKTSTRDIPMNTTVGKILLDQWHLYAGHHVIIRLNDPVFSQYNGNRTYANIFQRVINHSLEMGRKQGIYIPHFSVHAFRRTFASRANRAGMAPNVLKEIMGHSSYKMTMDLYTHISMEDKEKAMKLLDGTQ